MKKMIAIAALASSTAVFAADVTVGFGRTNTVDSNTATVAVGQQFGAVRAEASLGVVPNDGVEANVIGLSVAYPLTTIRGVSLAAKGGVNYVAGQSSAANGYAFRAGVEATYPLIKNVALVSTFERVEAQKRIERTTEGNVFTVGLRTSF